MSDSDIERRPLVSLRLNLRQKANWQRQAEQQDEYTSLSHLIRIAVEKEINSDSEEPHTGGQVVDEIQPSLDAIQEDIEQLQNDVSWLRSREEHSVEELAHQIFSGLPAVKADGSDESASQMGTIAGGNPQTVNSLADRYDTTPARVEEAIDFLKDQHMPIVRFDVRGETHWFKEE